jgi:hypothetical protein
MQIRKCERWTSYNCSEVANLDPEKFKTLSVPFEGETDEDFFEYISSNMYELEEIYEEFDEETWSEFEKILQPVYLKLFKQQMVDIRKKNKQIVQYNL